MPTVFISASDTGCGKTYVTAALACRLLLLGHSVQVVKAVETGVDAATPRIKTDIGFVEAFVARHAGAHQAALKLATLQCFARPLAPLDAALLEGRAFSFDALVDAFLCLPQAEDWKLVEGAGGLGVPLEDASNNEPRDWADFAHAIGAEATVLVVADRLGAINQARLLASYAVARGVPQSGLWLNEAHSGTHDEVRGSNANALCSGAAVAPLWAIHNHGELWPERVCAPWLM